MEQLFYVRTQVDRLPDLDVDGSLMVQLGLRVSAVISVEESTPVDPAQAETLANDLKPWKWREPKGDQEPGNDGSWDPHGAKAWRVFRVNSDADVLEITNYILDGETVDPIGTDALPPGYLDALDQDIAEMRVDPSTYALHKDAMSKGRAADEAADRTIFGLVESLSGLPHPIPAASRVFSAVSIPADSIADLSKDTVFLAFPRMAPLSGGAPKIDEPVVWGLFPTIRDTVAVANETPHLGEAPLWDKINFDCRASEKITFLRNAGPNAMLDAAALNIRFDPMAQEQSTDDDWVAHLPVRLAEAVDPALRVQAALDAVLPTALSDDIWATAAAKEETTLDELQRTSIRRLQNVLNVLAADVMLPRAVSTRTQQHPLPTILNDMALDDALPRPEDRREAKLLLMHHLAAESGLQATLADADWTFVRQSRLQQGLGLFNDAGDAEQETESGRHVLDSAEGFRGFALDHWFGAGIEEQGQSDGLSVVLLEYHSNRKPNVMLLDALAKGITTRRSIVKSRLLSRADEDGGLPFRATLAAEGEQATIVLGRIGPDTRIDLHSFTITRGANETTITLDTVTETIAFALTHIDILFHRSDDAGGRLTVDIASDRTVASVTSAEAKLLPAEISVALDGKAQLVQPTGSLRILAGEKLTASRLREDMALAFTAPFIPGLLRGQLNWTEPLITTSPAGNLRERIGNSAAALVKLLLETWRDETLPVDGTKDHIRDLILRPIINALIEASARDARIQIQTAIPGLGMEFASVSNAALPLSIQFDQMLDFGDTDLLQRLAGFGCFIGRSRPGEDPELLFSLNAAEIAARDARDGAQQIDPAPILPGERAGVGQAILRYNNRWPATRGNEDIVLEGDAPLHRRPEQLLPPEGANKPALSSGYDMHVLPYPIGQGGPLPIWLRKDPKKPLLRKDPPAGKPWNALAFGDIEDSVATIRYLRSRAVGVPLIAPTAKGAPTIPTVPAGLDPLAKELLIRPTPLTLHADTRTCFFSGAQPGRGVLSPEALPSAAPPGTANGFRIEFGGVALGETFTLAVYGKALDATAAAPSRIFAMSITAAKPLLRFDLLQEIDPASGPVLSLTPFQADPPKWAEDVPEYEALGTAPAPVAGDYKELFLVLSGDGVTLEAPVARPVARLPTPAPADTRRQANQVSSNTADPLEQVGEVLIAPEATHSSRQILLINGMQPQSVERFRIRRPSVDFATFERWINSGFLDDKATGTGFKGILNKAFDLSVFDADEGAKQSGDARRNPSKDYDDPAVIGTLIELVQVFPKFAPEPVTRLVKTVPSSLMYNGFQQPNGDLFQEPDPKLFFTCEVKSGTNGDLQNARLDMQGDVLEAIVPPGHCYELRFSAVIPNDQSDVSSVAPMQRLSEAVRATLRLVPKAGASGEDIWVGGAQVVTVEAAKMHAIDAFGSGWDTDTGVAELRRPPDFGTEVVRIRLPQSLVTESAYPEMRLIRDVTLDSQRWSWRGRPQPDIHPFDLFHGAADNARSIKSVADAAFSDRRIEDIGPTQTRKLERNHVYEGRQRQSQDRLPAVSDRPVLFEKQLDWQAGMHLRRFGLRLQSRYALLPHEGASITRTHVSGSNAPRWSTVVIPDRKSNRAIGRPGLALVLPLTEPRISRDPTPPLLVLLNERLYDKKNFADGVEVVIEMARHPYTPAEQQTDQDPDGPAPTAIERLKYWQEIGPDPIRTHAGSEGRIIPLRMDGPIGYGSDAGTETETFTSASFLLNPAGERIAPWTFAKLRLRRLESPEAMFKPNPKATPPIVERPQVALTSGVGATLQVRNTGEDGTKARTDVQVFDAYKYEGLVIDLTISVPRDATTIEGEFSFSLMEAEVEPAPVSIRYKVARTQVALVADTRLGPAGETSFDLKGATDIHLRMVVSEREKPSTDPNAQRKDAEWTPAGDVSVRLFINDNAELAQGQNLERNSWLSILAVPLLSDVGTTAPIDDPVIARIRHVGVSADAVVRPARLSQFTPSVWCQFGESMSVFGARYIGADSDKPTWLSTAEPKDFKATVQLDGDVARITLSSPNLEKDFEKRQENIAGPLALEPVAEVDDTAQLEERLFVVITYFTKDVFDRTQERPFAIVPITEPEADSAPDGKYELRVAIGARDNTHPALDGENRMPFGDGHGGRLRILKILVPKERDRSGYARFRIEDVLSVMAPAVGNSDEMNPTDAEGIFLGISHPLELRETF